MLTIDAKLSIKPHVHARAFDDEFVIVDLDRGEYYGLDEVGSEAWKRLASGLTVGQTVNELAEIYDVEVAVLREDLLALGNEWIRLGLVQPEAGP